MTQFKYWFLRFDNKKIAQWNLRTNEQKRIKNLVKSPRTILTIYYKYFCETDNMAQIGNARINQLINQADEIDDSIDTMNDWMVEYPFFGNDCVTNFFVDFAEFVTEINDDFWSDFGRHWDNDLDPSHSAIGPSWAALQSSQPFADFTRTRWRSKPMIWSLYIS